jgi:hypothetical protein
MGGAAPTLELAVDFRLGWLDVAELTKNIGLEKQHGN